VEEIGAVSGGSYFGGGGGPYGPVVLSGKPGDNKSANPCDSLKGGLLNLVCDTVVGIGVFGTMENIGKGIRDWLDDTSTCRDGFYEDRNGFPVQTCAPLRPDAPAPGLVPVPPGSGGGPIG
jgi:hypothetical protein